MTSVLDKKELNESIGIASSDGLYCKTCGMVKRKTDFPWSIRKMAMECRACRGEHHEEVVHDGTDKPQFVFCKDAEIV